MTFLINNFLVSLNVGFRLGADKILSTESSQDVGIQPIIEETQVDEINSDDPITLSSILSRAEEEKSKNMFAVCFPWYLLPENVLAPSRGCILNRCEHVEYRIPGSILGHSTTWSL